MAVVRDHIDEELQLPKTTHSMSLVVIWVEAQEYLRDQWVQHLCTVVVLAEGVILSLEVSRDKEHSREKNFIINIGMVEDPRKKSQKG
jgi:hypothetical protein